MKKDLPIWIMEPDQIRKRAAVAQKLLETTQTAPVVPKSGTGRKVDHPIILIKEAYRL